ncbi:3 beta-hydroxysteroid dehydrogenase/Delta 5--_4-isomerase [Rubripirellula lacrimiformis]|uniref:3 beta-hydroxysteroid dehydrogenase/Delta 5-->4-isomerase n=2 Tax=Rubripirellula lacrimiformis TaxID=1930273 RepID=A0A517N4J9_9BACT|nr:3 beta-hydroxysteroid dehydrogenase/Delta 5-->4-isomerase [Rubripirellula lacrimiformis]
MNRVLVCGATGYVGGRLVPRLLDEGLAVRCLVRSPEKIRAFAWADHERLEIVQGNLDDTAVVHRAAIDVDAAFYLVHSMISAGEDYAKRDRELANSFVAGLDGTTCKRVIYLGGLGELGPDLSHHLHSRREVAEILGQSNLDTTVFRAAMIVGSGSASFEILRYLVERLPIMITPKWVKMETQPIAIRDVIRYLVQCLQVPETAGQVIDIGGKDVFTYQELMQVMAKSLGLAKRIILPIPVLTPRLSSAWISLVTPVNARIARPLAEGLRNRTVCRDDNAQRLMPGPLFGVEEAIDAALGKWRTGDVETRWSTAGAMPGDPEWSGGTVFLDQRSKTVEASAAQTFAALSQIGGRCGYWGADWLWWLRGLMDKAIGGPGLRRGRRHPKNLSYGEAVDFWRVNGYQKDEWLRLIAEMKLPGDAELEFRVESIDDTHSRLIQTARFRPTGLLGLAYWYSVLPLHYFVFPRMINGIVRDAERGPDSTSTVMRQ